MENISALQSALDLEKIPYTLQTPLSAHTTFRIGGPAAVFAEPTSVAQLQSLLTLCQQAGCRFFLLGNGSNLLFSDEGFDGVVIHIGAAMSRMERQEPNLLFCEAGAPLKTLCHFAAQQGLDGLQFAFGIPGTVGGAIYMNAGAYGGEMRNVLHSVTFLDQNNQLATRPAPQLDFGYRDSYFQHHGGCIVSCTFLLHPGDPVKIAQEMTAVMKKRADKQPLNHPSAGSAFKRPEGAYAAALIEKCNLKGYRVGGAAVSEKHAGFIVNLGGATCRDVETLAEHVAMVVQDQTGFTLEKEIRIVR